MLVARTRHMRKLPTSTTARNGLQTCRFRISSVMLCVVQHGSARTMVEAWVGARCRMVDLGCSSTVLMNLRECFQSMLHWDVTNGVARRMGVIRELIKSIQQAMDINDQLRVTLPAVVQDSVLDDLIAINVPKRIVTLDGMTLNTLDVFDVANENATVAIAENAMMRVGMARDVVDRIVGGNETVYGINTGFGSLVHTKISHDDVGTFATQLDTFLMQRAWTNIIDFNHSSDDVFD